VPWRQSHKGGTIDDRMLREIEVSIPADITDSDPLLPSAVIADCDEAVRAIAVLDATEGAHLKPLASLLLRAESIASSKIEHEEASVEDYVGALHGVKSNKSAVAMADATGALDRLLSHPLTLDEVLASHRHLMAHDEHDGVYAGKFRPMQNWIGGSDHSPRNAIYVPPPPEQVEPKMRDLIRFANRTDLPVIAQAAIAHAQLEAIHPFTDGNGRIGRALASSVLRQRGVTTQVAVPMASGLAARRSAYFDALNDYHSGEHVTIVRLVAQAATDAATESRLTSQRLRELPMMWAEQAGNPQAGSAVARTLGFLSEEPVFTPEDLAFRLRASSATIYRAVERLADTGILRPLTNRKRDQVWGAGAVLDELQDLAVRIEGRARRR
jgi:Fic family protein